MNTRSPVLYTLAEVQIMLDCEEDTVRTLIQNGKIAAIKASRSWLFPCAAFDARLNEWATADAADKRSAVGRRSIATPLVNQPLPNASRRRIPPTLRALA